MPKIIMPQTPAQAQSDQEAKIFGSPKDRLNFYRHEIHFETNNLSSRTNAYLSAQAFLVIAYASSMANLNPNWGAVFTLVVPPMLALFGLASSISAWPGIKASCDIIDHWYYKQSGLLQSEPVIGLAYDDSPLFSSWESSDKGHKKSLLFSKRTPWMFAIFWVFLGLFAMFIQFTNPAH